MAYEFSNESMDLFKPKVDSNGNKIPILSIAGVFFIGYYPGYLIIYFIKNLKQHGKKISPWYVIGSITLLIYLVQGSLNYITEIMWAAPLVSPVLSSILLIPLVISGVIQILKSLSFFQFFKKHRIILILVVILFSYFILSYIIDFILKKLEVVDTNFSLEQYIINATSIEFYKLNEKIIQSITI
jgi:hypothetical protein